MLRKTTSHLTWAIALMTVSLSISAQTKVVVIPLFGDEAAEPASKTVFLTDNLYAGNSFSGSQGADSLCAAEASGAGLHGTYKAFVAEGTASAKPPRPLFSYTGGNYVNVNGAVVSSGFIELFDNILSAPILTATGSSISTLEFWSGISSSLSLYGGWINRCHDWGISGTPLTGHRGEYIGFGFIARIDSSTDSAPVACTLAYALLCIEQ